MGNISNLPVKLKVIRKESNLLQKEMAESLGITVRRWQYYESGKRRVPAEILLQLARKYGKELSYFMA